MKTIFSSHHAVAQAFAKQQTPRGKTSGNRLYFEGTSAFSYGSHFEIARIEGRKAYFTTRKYSRSTGKHKGYVYSARRAEGFTIIEVADPRVGYVPPVELELPWLTKIAA